MMRRFQAGVVVTALLLAAACGGTRTEKRAPRPDPRVITREQMLERHFLNAMDAVQSLKANWITPRGPDSFVVPSQLWVYFDNVRLGGAASLRTINVRDIAYLQYFNGIEATSRWGVGHGSGVILAASWPGGEPLEKDSEEPVAVETSAGPLDSTRMARFDWFSYESDDSGSAVGPYLEQRPALPRRAAPAIPTNGNFTIRDEFDGPELAPYWQLIGTPGTRWYDFTSHPGSLTLRPRHAGVDVASQPSFVGRRQQHLSSSASTAMRYVPVADGDKAGLLAFHNDQYYYLLAVARVGGNTLIRLEKHAGPATGPDDGVIASVPVTLSASRPVYLKIQARGGRYDFYYGTRDGEWTLLQGDADGTILSTKVAGGFVGTLFGLYAFSAAP